MITLPVNLEERSYPINIKRGLAKNALEQADYIVTDSNIADKYQTLLKGKKVIITEPGESSKSFEGYKYLALKLTVGTNTYYGWARLDFLEMSGSFTIKDYAYESTPNACIQAGRTTLGSTENGTTPIFSVFPNHFISSTTIQTIENLNNATLTIYNSYGKMVKQVTNISGQTATLTRENLSSGLYFIRLTEENKIIAAEKLIIID